MEVYKDNNWSIHHYTPLDGEFFLVMKQGRMFAKTFSLANSMLIVKNIPCEVKKEINYHNPDNVSKEKLPNECRFLLEKEREFLFNNRSYSYGEEYINKTAFWNMNYNKWVYNISGSYISCRYSTITYAVPIEFRIPELGEYEVE